MNVTGTPTSTAPFTSLTVAVIVCFEEGRNDHVKMVSPGIVMFESVNIASVNSSFVQPRCQNHQNIENVLFFLNFYWPLL